MGNVGVTTLVLLVIVFISCNQVPKASAILFDVKKHVYIINNLEAGKDLTIHCRSKDDDLGEHHLAFNQEFTWSFKDNFFLTTKFWCYFAWQDSSGKWVTASFDVYGARRDEYRCQKRCRWLITETALYCYNEDKGLWNTMFTWPPN